MPRVGWVHIQGKALTGSRSGKIRAIALLTPRSKKTRTKGMKLRLEGVTRQQVHSPSKPKAEESVYSKVSEMVELRDGLVAA